MLVQFTKSELRLVLDGIKCASEYKYALSNEFDNGYLEIAIQEILKNNLADDLKSALEYFVTYYQESQQNSTQKINTSDLEKTSNNSPLYRKIDIQINRERLSKKKDFSREFGVRGHVTIPNLFSGNFIKLEKKKENDQKSIAKQIGMNFEGEINFDQSENAQVIVNSQEKITLSHIRKIQILWRKIVNKMGSDMFPSHTEEYKELLSLMLAVFGDDLRALFKLSEKSEEHEYLTFLTVLTWVTCIIRYRDVGTTVLFKEVRLFPDHYDVSLGRIDALEVVLIDNRPPTLHQTRILERLNLKRYDSVGELLYTLVRTFGKKLTIKIHDWKFAVGDGDNGAGKTLNVVHFSEVQIKPLLKHIKQMERYLSTAMISFATIASSYSNQEEDLWHSDAFDISGEIHYFFPDKIWISHKVELSSEEKKQSFTKIANGYRDAEFRRKFLNISKSLLKLTLKLMRGGSQKVISRQLVLQEIIDGSHILNGHTHRTGRISQMMQNSVERVFIDEFKIFEKDYFPKSKVPDGAHLDKLVEAMDDGTVKIGNDFRKNGRGFIFCPVHYEKSPSCSISLPKRLITCFGCGLKAKIIESSIPADISASRVVNGFINRGTREIRKLVIPQEHQDIMACTQKLLKRGFMDSPGAKYLEENRKLNAELAHYHRGAGYGGLHVISGLLEEGFSYDKLLEYGILKISEKITRITPLVNLLQQQGLSFSEIQKAVPSIKAGIPDSVGLPFFPLGERLTYPLDIAGIINNIYGRSLDPNCDKRHRHMKLSSEFTNMPHGGFNMGEAFRKEIGKNNPILIVEEAPLNVETFIQISIDMPSVVGLVGVNNDTLFELLADFPGSLLISLNNDDAKFDEKTGEQLFDKQGKPLGMTGQKNTIAMAQKVRNMGFTGSILTFTKPFVNAYPQVKYNDLNQWWTEYGQANGELIKARSFLESIVELPDPNWGFEQTKDYWVRNYPVVKK